MGSKSFRWIWSYGVGELFRPSEFEDIAGRAFDNSTDFVGVMNAAWDDNDVIPCGAIYQDSDGIVYCAFTEAPARNSWVRVNYLIALGG